MASQSNYLTPDLSTSHYHRRIGQKYKHDGQGKTYVGHIGRNKRQGVPDAWANSDAPTDENNYPTRKPAGQPQRFHKVTHQANLRDAVLGPINNPLRDSVIGNRQHVEASGLPAYATWKDSNNKEYVRELRPVAPSRVAAAHARRQERAQRLAELTPHLATIEEDERRAKKDKLRRQLADDPVIKRMRKRDPMLGKPRISLKLHQQLLSKPLEYKANLQNELHSRARHLLKAFYEETRNTKLTEELEAESTNWWLRDILVHELFKEPKLQEIVWKERIVNLLNLLEHYGSGVGVPRELPYSFSLEPVRRRFAAGGNIYPLTYSSWFKKHDPSTPKREFTDGHPYGLPSPVKNYLSPTTTTWATSQRMILGAQAAHETGEAKDTMKHNPLPRPPHPYDPNVLVKDKAERRRIQEESNQKKRIPPPVSPHLQDLLDGDTEHDGEADDNDDPFYKGTWEGPTSPKGEWRTWSNGSPPPAEQTSPASSSDGGDGHAVSSHQASNDVFAAAKNVNELAIRNKASMTLFPDGDESIFAGSLRNSSMNAESADQMPQPGKLVPDEWMIKAVEDEWKALNNKSDGPLFKSVPQRKVAVDIPGIPSLASNLHDKTPVPQIMVRGPPIPNFGYNIIREDVPPESNYDENKARAWADIPKISPRAILEANFDRATFDRSSGLVTPDAEPADASQAEANNLWDATTDIAATYKDTPVKETQLVKFAETVEDDKQFPEVSFSREPALPVTDEDRIFWRKLYKHRPPQYLQKTTGHLFDQAPVWAVVKKLPTVQSTKAEKERAAAREKAEKEEQERTDALLLGAGLNQDDEMFGMGGLPRAVSDGGYKHHSSHNPQNIASPSKWLSPNLRVPFDGLITGVPESVRGPAQGTNGLDWPVSPNFQHGHNHNGMMPGHGHGHGGIWHPEHMQPSNLGNGYSNSWATTEKFNGQQQTFGQQKMHMGPYGTSGYGSTTAGYGNGTWQQGNFQTAYAGPGYAGSNGQRSGTRACGVGPHYGGFGSGNVHHHNPYKGPRGSL